MIFLTILAWALLAVFVIATVLPLSKVPFGIVRGGEFPREQIFVLCLVLAVAFPFVQQGQVGVVGAAIAVLIAAVQLIYVVKFTPIWRKQSVTASDDLRSQKDRQISLDMGSF